MKKLLIIASFLFSNAYAELNKVEVKDLGAQPAVVKEMVLTAAELATEITNTHNSLRSTLQGAKIALKSAPFVRTLNISNGKFTVQAGYIVAAKPKSVGGYKVIDLPSGKHASVTIQGSYADPKPGIKLLADWFNKNKIEDTSTTLVQFYLDNPAAVKPPNQKLEIQIPFKQ
jgi:predicted transcriptional regulator YdeE